MNSNNFSKAFIILALSWSFESKSCALQSFCKIYLFNSLTKQPTCFRNPENLGWIDLVLTNKPRSFQNKCVAETGLSDFHRITTFFSFPFLFFLCFTKTNYIKTKTNTEYLIKIYMVLISSEMKFISNIDLISGLLKK